MCLLRPITGREVAKLMDLDLDTLHHTTPSRTPGTYAIDPRQ